MEEDSESTEQATPQIVSGDAPTPQGHLSLAVASQWPSMVVEGPWHESESATASCMTAMSSQDNGSMPRSIGKSPGTTPKMDRSASRSNLYTSSRQSNRSETSGTSVNLKSLWLKQDDIQHTYSTRSLFIKAMTRSQSFSELEVACNRPCLVAFLLSPLGEWLFGAVILLNFVVIILETDWKAKTTAPIPTLYAALSMGCHVVYCVEFGCRIYALRKKVLNSHWFLLDAIVVITGNFELILEAVGTDVAASNTLRAMRLLRLLRLMRALKILWALRELRKLIEMMASCLRTLFWSFILCFVVVTLWSIVTVELLNNVVLDMYDSGEWPDCDVCQRYTSSVMHANLFYFQTIIAGDSWGRIAVPVVERHPWAMIIFGGALVSVIFGVLNLVVAVVVDTFADIRSKDMTHLAGEIELEELAEKKELFKIFREIDRDASGEVSWEELVEAAARVPAFRNRLRVMDIDRGDLHHLFQLIDADGSGEIDPEEFIETLYRVKHTEAKTATKIIKHYLMHMLPLIRKDASNVRENVHKLNESRADLDARTKLHEARLEQLFSTSSEVEATIHALREEITQHEDVIKNELLSMGRCMTSALEQLETQLSTDVYPILRGISSSEGSRSGARAATSSLSAERSPTIVGPSVNVSAWRGRGPSRQLSEATEAPPPAPVFESGPPSCKEGDEAMGAVGAGPAQVPVPSPKKPMWRFHVPRPLQYSPDDFSRPKCGNAARDAGTGGLPSHGTK